MSNIFLGMHIPFMLAILVATGSCTSAEQNSGSQKADIYVCTPCGQDCDQAEYNKEGSCSQCNMQLVKKSTIVHREIKPAELCDFIKSKGSENVVLLDVRTKAEFEGTAAEKFGKLNHAINIPIQQLSSRIDELDQYKNKEIVVYCSHSHRSPRASYLLTQKGFGKITNMSGGMSVWQSEVKDEACNQQLYIKQ